MLLESANLDLTFFFDHLIELVLNNSSREEIKLEQSLINFVSLVDDEVNEDEDSSAKRNVSEWVLEGTQQNYEKGDHKHKYKERNGKQLTRNDDLGTEAGFVDIQSQFPRSTFKPNVVKPNVAQESKSQQNVEY